MRDTEYSPPILATIFFFIGFLALLLGATWVFVAVSASHAAGVGLLLTLSAAAPALAALGLSLVPFGTGQVINLVGKTAFYSQRTASLADFNGELSAGREKEMLAALNFLAASFKRLLEVQSRLENARRFYVSQNGQTQGPYTLDIIKTMVQSGAIKSDAFLGLFRRLRILV